MKYYFLTTVFFIVTVFSLISCGQENLNEKIVGKWETPRDQYNMSTVFEFLPDSTITMTTQANVDYKYSLEGNKLISISQNPQTGEQISDTAVIEINSGNLLMIRNNGGFIDTTFLTKQNGDPDKLEGEWSWMHETGKPGISKYKDDGTAAGKILVEERVGTYSIVNDSLNVTFPGTSHRGIAVKVESDTLYMSTHDGKRAIPHRKVD
jgi:hypothetical protein